MNKDITKEVEITPEIARELEDLISKNPEPGANAGLIRDALEKMREPMRQPCSVSSTSSAET